MLLTTEPVGYYFIYVRVLTLGYIGPKLTCFQDPLGVFRL